METRKQQMMALLGTQVHVEVDRPMGYLHGNIRYPVNYGYIPGIMAADGEEQDAYILGVSKPLSAFDGQVIGIVFRRNDVEDKLVVAPEGTALHQAQIAEAVHFQEQYFDSYVLPLFHKSCGVLPWRETLSGREYLLVFEQFSQCWSLPKGHMEMGETEAETALRELQEETGLTAQLDTTKSAAIEYPLGRNGRKQVVFFPGQVRGTPIMRPGETERYQWVKAEELAQYLFPDAAKACQELIRQIDAKLECNKLGEI